MSGRPRAREPATRGAEAVIAYCDREDLSLSGFAALVSLDNSNLGKLLYDSDPNVGLRILKRIEERTGKAVHVQWWTQPPLGDEGHGENRADEGSGLVEAYVELGHAIAAAATDAGRETFGQVRDAFHRLGKALPVTVRNKRTVTAAVRSVRKSIDDMPKGRI